MPDPRTLTPTEFLRLINGTRIGHVLDRRQLSRDKSNGAQIGAHGTVDLARYLAFAWHRAHAPPRPAGMSYEDRKAQIGARSRSLASIARDIGPIPPVHDPERRERGRLDLKTFCEVYMAESFSLAWGPDHLVVIARLQEVILSGGQYALAMPRGSGKSSLCDAACIWAAVYGHRHFILEIGPSKEAALEAFDGIASILENAVEIGEDFPEVCGPIRALEGIANRCAGQTSEGRRTEIQWTQSALVLPTIEGSGASGTIVRVAGLTGRIRGLRFRRADGSSARPDLVIVDDPQTDKSAQSVSQCATRERLLAGAVLGLAGPGQRIAAVMPCTVIRKGDVADNLLDRKLHPEWNGQRMKMLAALPENAAMWDRYGELAGDSLREHGDIRDATAFYAANREAMDAGAVAAWPARFLEGELSAIQHAMTLKLADERAFAAEYQNEPIDTSTTSDVRVLTPDDITGRLNGSPRGTIPIGESHLVAFVDVQAEVLVWMVAAFADDFTGSVISCGTFPDQGRDYWTLSDLRDTLGTRFPGAGLEGAIYAGLDALVGALGGAEWPREDGTGMRIERLLIDASWGQTTDTVYQFARQSVHASVILPSHGRYVGPAGKPFDEWTKKPGDRLGVCWRIPAARGRRAIRHLLYDTNFWKTFVAERIAVPMGDRGSLTLWGRARGAHRLLADHMCSERRERVAGPSRTVDVWTLKPGQRENHLLDCLVGCAVAAAVTGCSLPSQSSAYRGARKRMTLEEWRAAKGAKR